MHTHHTASPAPATGSGPLSVQQAIAAFSLWNSEFRDAPESFLTQEEFSAMAIAPLSEAQAIYFVGVLRTTCQASGEVAA